MKANWKDHIESTPTADDDGHILVSLPPLGNVTGTTDSVALRMLMRRHSMPVSEISALSLSTVSGKVAPAIIPKQYRRRQRILPVRYAFFS